MPDTPQPNTRTVPVGDDYPRVPLPIPARADRSYTGASPYTDRSDIVKTSYRGYDVPITSLVTDKDYVINCAGKAVLITSDIQYESGVPGTEFLPSNILVAFDDSPDFIPVQIGKAAWADGIAGYAGLSLSYFYLRITFSKIRIRLLVAGAGSPKFTVFQEDVGFHAA